MNTSVFSRFGVVCAVVLTIAINALANSIPLNGKTTGEIPDQFAVFFMPAGYVFSIWSVIYVGLLLFAFYQVSRRHKSKPMLARTRALVILSCVANSAWILLWHYGYFAYTVLIMIVLLFSLIAIYRRLRHKTTPFTFAERVCAVYPFSIYLGWISVATIANVSVALTAAHWDGWGVAPEVWCVMMMCVASVLSLMMLVRFRDALFSLVIVWAISGIGVRFNDLPTILYPAIALCVIQTGFIMYVVIRRWLR